MGTFVERARTFVERARTHLACVTDASIGKGIPFRTTGAKACGMQGTPVVAAGHTERAWGYNAGLPIDHTSITGHTFTFGVGLKQITWVTEWAPLASLSEGEHKVWAFGPH